MIKRTFAGVVLLVTLLVPGMASAQAPSPDALATARELVAVSRAAELYAESLALRARLRLGGTGAPSLWHNLGYVALHAGDHATALARFRESLSMYQEQNDRRERAEYDHQDAARGRGRRVNLVHDVLQDCR